MSKKKLVKEDGRLGLGETNFISGKVQYFLAQPARP